MNRSYKTIWNEALGAWVATSEHSAARGKKSRSSRTRDLSIATLAVAAAIASPGLHAQATLKINTPVTDNSARVMISATDSTDPDANDGVIITRVSNFAGNSATALNPGLNPVATANGMQVFLTAPTTFQGKQYVPGLHYWDAAANTWVAMVSTANLATTLSTGIPYFHANSTDPDSVAGGLNSVAIGPSTTAAGPAALAAGNGATAAGSNSIAIGNGATASSYTAIAVGLNATASGSYGSVAIGGSDNPAFANTAGQAGTAVGFGSSALATDSNGVISNDHQGGSAFGTYAKTSGGSYNTALGYKAASTGAGDSLIGNGYSTAVGSFSGASANGASALGASSKASGTGSTALGSYANASGAGAIAIGGSAVALPLTNAVASGTNSISLGTSASASGTSSISVGTGNKVSGNNSGAIGDPNTLSGSGSYALGNNNTIAANNAFVVGNNVTIATGLDGAVGIGDGSTVTASTVASYNPGTGTVAGAAVGSNVVSVGASGAERRITNVAAGGADTDAVNVSQLKAVSSAASAIDFPIRSGNAGPYITTTTATGVDSLAAGATARAYGTNNTVVGERALAGEVNTSVIRTTVIGAHSAAGGSDQIVIGATSSTGFPQGRTIVIGNNSFATSNTDLSISAVLGLNNSGSVVVGHDSTADGISVGIGNDVDAEFQSVAVGSNSTASASKSVALGFGAKATTANSVALGAESVTAAPTTAYNPGAGTIAGATAAGVVSIGRAGAERQITNVAAGGADTDAVNVSQLKAVGAVAGDKWVIGSPTTYVAPTSSGTNSTAVGSGAMVNANNSVAVGTGASATTANSVALGNGSITSAAVATTGVTMQGTAYTFAGAAPVGVVSVGGVGSERTITNVAAGRVSGTSTDAVNGSQLYATNQAVTKISNGAGIKYFHATSISPDSQATGTDSIAVGPNAKAFSESSVAMGNGAVAGFAGPANNLGQIAIGRSASAIGDRTLAMGDRAVASGIQSIALGLSANATNTNSIAIGTEAGGTPGAQLNTAVGAYAIAGEGATSLGAQTSAAGNRSIAAGSGANAAANLSVAIGADAKVDQTAASLAAQQSGGVAIGAGAHATNGGTTAGFYTATAVGTATIANGDGTGAFGEAATANAQFATALGSTATASVAGGVALGSGSVASVAGGATGYAPVGSSAAASAAIGATNSTTLGAVSVGTGAAGGNRQIVNVAAGTNDSDAVNVSQLKALDASVVANKTRYFSVNSTGGGNVNNDGATGLDAIAIGKNASAVSDGSMAIGSGATAAGTFNSLAVGTGASVTGSGNHGTAIGAGAVSLDSGQAFGALARADSTASTAVGASANASGGGIAIGDSANAAAGIAIGRSATNNGMSSTVVLGDGAQTVGGGNSATVIGARSSAVAGASAFGADAHAGAIDSVSLGKGSIANVFGGAAGFVPASASAPAAAAIAATNSTNLGAVSVGTGAAGGNRQIVNVAAGTNDADAVNVSQLKALDATVASSKVKYFSVASTGGGNEDNLGATGANAIAVGRDAVASAPQSLAVGKSATAANQSATAVGFQSAATGAYSAALGESSTAMGMYEYSVGTFSGLTSAAVQAAGDAKYGTGAGGNHFGQINVRANAGLEVSGVQGLYVGGNAGSYSSGWRNLAVGQNSGRLTNGDSNAAVGANAGESVTGNGNSAFGNYAGGTVTGNDNVAVGSNAGFNITANNTVSVGNAANASADNAIAIGTGAIASGTKSISIGTGNVVSGNNSGAIGDPNTLSGSGSYALGNNNTIAANNAFVVGNNVTIATGLDGAVGIGDGSTVTASTVASYNPGTGTVAGTAVGSNVVSVGASGAERRITNVAAGGADTDAVNVSQLKAVGAVAGDKWVIGSPTTYVAPTSSGTNSTAVGSGAMVNANNSVAVGTGASATTANSVALGNGSITSAAVATTGVTMQGTAYTFAGAAPVGVVSVGDVGSERIITNVAAGRVSGSSTDAINGSQLFATNSAIQGVADTPLTFTGNDNTAGPVTRKLGDTLAISGTATTAGTYSGANLKTVTDASTGAVNLQMADNPAFTSVTTGNTTINTNGLTIVGGPSVTTTGIDAGNRKITNVTAGTANTDAVNVSQLRTVSDAVSAIDFPIRSSNGKPYTTTATGTDALAVGANAQATANNTTAVGENAVATNTNETSVGSTAGTVTAAGNVNNTSVGAGSGNGTSGFANTALGVRSGQNIVGDLNTSIGIDAGSGTVGQGNLAIGTLSAQGTTGSGNVALGELANSSSAGAAIVADNTVAIGTVSRAQANSAVALGANAVARNVGDVALGAGSVTAAANPTSSTSINGVTYGGFAGAAPTSVVSVGSVGGERQITNVAAGRISGTSTDAINGSQLYATNQAITTVNMTANKGWNVQANGDAATNVAPGDTVQFKDGQNIAVTRNGKDVTIATTPALMADSLTINNGGPVINSTGITMQAGNTLNMGGNQITNVAPGTAGTDAVNVNQLNVVNTTANKGWNVTAQGANGTNVAPGASVDLKNTDGNVVVGKTGANNDVTFDLAPNLAVTSVTTGNTTINTNGLTIIGGPSVTTTGIDAANTKITNVAAGTAATDAVNVSQLTAVNTTANKGWNVQANGDTATNVAPGDTVQFKDGQNIAVTRNGKDVTIATTPALTADSLTINNGGPVINSTGITMQAGNTLNMGGNQITNVAPGTAGTDAVNLNQLNVVNTTANKGWNVTAQGANGTNVAPGASVDLKNTDGNVVVGKTGANNDVTFDLAPNLAVTSVTTGNTTINTNGLTIVGGPSVTTAGIDAANTKITNVAAGTAATDAVNVSQLTAVNTTANKGWNVQANGDAATNVAPGDTVQFKDGQNIAVTRNGKDVTIATTPALTADSLTINNGGPVINSTGITMQAGNTLNMGGNKIVNVGPGAIGATSTDAVNGSQLYATNVTVQNLGNTINTINNGGGVKYFHANSSAADSVASGAESVAVGPKAVASATNAVAMGNGASATKANSVALGADSKTTVGAQSGYTGAYMAAGSSNSVGEVSVGSAGAARTVTNVADGVNANDAVNVQQLQGGVTYAIDQSKAYTDQQVINVRNGAAGMFQVNQNVTKPAPSPTGVNSAAGGGGAVASGTNSVAIGNDSLAIGSNSTALGQGAQATAANSVAIGTGSVADRANTVSVGAVGKERQLANVAAGTAGTDGVNVNQLKGVQAGAVNYATNPDGSVNYKQVNLGNGQAPNGTVISNVAPGVAGTDAANVNQVNAGVASANQYTDAKVGQLQANIDKTAKDASAGTAGAMAMANLPQAYIPGKSLLSVGVAAYDGASAIALGVSKLSDNGQWIVKFSGTGNSRGKFGVAAGAGFSW